jgi:hypothetical protein
VRISELLDAATCGGRVKAMQGIGTFITVLKISFRACGNLRRPLVVSIAAALLWCSAVMRVDAAVIAIARGGDTAPSSGGATFTDFDEPMVNSAGDVVFEAGLSDGNEGIYVRPNGGALTKVAEQGDAVGGATLSSDFDGPAINDDGTVFFVNRGSTGSFTAAAFAMPSGGSVAPIIKQGDSAPGTSSGVFVSFDDMGVNAKKGDFAVIGSYTEDHGTTFKVGIWLNELINKKKGKTKLVPIILSGDALPGSGGGVLGTTTSPTSIDDLDGPWVDEQRHVAFAVDNISGGMTTLEGSIWESSPKRKIKRFVLLTDTPPSSLGGSISSVGVGRPGLVGGVLAVELEISGSSTTTGAIVTKQLGKSARVCVMNGQNAPGTTGTFSTTDGVSSPTFNNHGDLEFHSAITGDATNFGGEFVCDTKGKSNGTVTAAVLAGDTKPGGGSWSNPEEGSSSSNFITFLDDNSTPSVGGVFRADIPPP